MECIRTLYCEKDIGDAVNDVLRESGVFLNAERTYMFNLTGGFFNNDYEWCAENVGSRQEVLQNLGREQLEQWRGILRKEGCIVIKVRRNSEKCFREVRTSSGNGISAI